MQRNRPLFIDYTSPSWQRTLSLLSSECASFEEAVEIIKSLRLANWKKSKWSGLQTLDFDTNQFTENFRWSRHYIKKMPELFPNGIEEFSPCPYTEFSKEKCFSILASLFFCCSTVSHKIYDSDEKAKFKCLNCYFETIRMNPEYLGHVFSIERKKLVPYLSIGDWLSEDCVLNEFEIDTIEKIEEYRGSSLKVDFSSEFVGEGVLNGQCILEEILFSIYPELLVTMPLCEAMQEDEAIVITGAMRASNYSGCGVNFKFEGKSQEEIRLNWRNQVDNQFVAIDALRYIGVESQFNDYDIMRELNKAYTAFKRNMFEEDAILKPVVTGKWGCGEFGGFPPLKILIQWIAASKAGRKIIISTFHDKSLSDLSLVMEKYMGYPINHLLSLIFQSKSINLFNDLLENSLSEKKS